MTCLMCTLKRCVNCDQLDVYNDKASLMQGLCETSRDFYHMLPLLSRARTSPVIDK